MKNKKKILIVGGTGFIGYHVAKKCIKIGWQVTSISSKSPPQKRQLRKVKYIICDITKKNILKKKVNNYYNYIVNLGGYVVNIDFARSQRLRVLQFHQAIHQASHATGLFATTPIQ